LFRAARDADYAAISEEAKEVTQKFPATKKFNEERAGELETAVARLRRRLTEVVAIDFFDSLGRQSAEGLVAILEVRLNPDALGKDDTPGSDETDRDGDRPRTRAHLRTGDFHQSFGCHCSTGYQGRRLGGAE
jgi:hypothetical protein